MKVSDGKTLLKRYGFDDEDPLLIWLNLGLHEFEEAHNWPFLQFGHVISANAGDFQLLSLPSDFFRVQTIKPLMGEKLTYVDITGWERDIDDRNPSPGTPSHYTVVGSGIFLDRVLDINTDFRIIYQATLPEMVNDTDEMPGPARTHGAIVYGAAYMALQMENEEDRATTAQDQFDSAANRLWSKYSTQELDEPKQVVDVMGYGLC